MRTFLLFVCALAAVSAQEIRDTKCVSGTMSAAAGLCKGMTRSFSGCAGATITQTDIDAAMKVVRENLCR
jgi:hypothetical protein